MPLLLKTEPSTYSFADLQRDRRTTWDGVSNPAACRNLRDARKGDTVFIYHTGDEKAIVGTATIASDPYPDPSDTSLTKEGVPARPVIDLTVGAPVETPLTLAAMKSDARFKDFDLLRLSRLSVVPVPPAIERAIRQLTGARNRR